MHEGEGRHAWFDEPATTTGSLLAVPTVPPPAPPGDDAPEGVADQDADDLEELDDPGPDEDGRSRRTWSSSSRCRAIPCTTCSGSPRRGDTFREARHTRASRSPAILARLTVPPPVMEAAPEAATVETVTDEPPAPLALRRSTPPTPGRSARRRTNVFGRGNSRALGASTGVLLVAGAVASVAGMPLPGVPPLIEEGPGTGGPVALPPGLGGPGLPGSVPGALGPDGVATPAQVTLVRPSPTSAWGSAPRAGPPSRAVASPAAPWPVGRHAPRRRRGRPGGANGGGAPGGGGVPGGGAPGLPGGGGAPGGGGPAAVARPAAEAGPPAAVPSVA